MINQFKRNPTIISQSPGNFLTIIEMSVGTEDDDIIFNDVNIGSFTEAFIRHVYASIPEEYSPANSKKMMATWSVHEPTLANSFADLVEQREESVTSVRLMAIFQNGQIRFNVHFLSDERDQVVELPITGCSSRSVALKPVITPEFKSHRFVFVIDLSTDDKLLAAIFAENIYFPVNVNAAVSSFTSMISERFDQVSRVSYQEHREVMQKAGVATKQLAAIKAVRYSDLYNSEHLARLLADSINKAIEERLHLRKLSNDFPEILSVDTDPKLDNQVVVLEARIEIQYDQTHGLTKPPEIVVCNEILTTKNYRYEDGTTDRIVKVFYIDGVAAELLSDKERQEQKVKIIDPLNLTQEEPRG